MCSGPEPFRAPVVVVEGEKRSRLNRDASSVCRKKKNYVSRFFDYVIVLLINIIYEEIKVSSSFLHSIRASYLDICFLYVVIWKKIYFLYVGLK